MKQLNWYQIFGKSNIPDGRTVEPTDDIQIWLHCANIWDKAYTTLAEVLADTDTLSALIASNNAVDYMVRSVSWANDTSVPTMTSNTTPSGEVIFLAEHSDYKGYKAFDGNNSSFWNTGSPTLPTWLGYDFQTKKRIESVYVQFASYNTSATVKVQGSDDKITWNDESEETVVTSTTATTIPADGYYRYHRLYISSQTKTSTNSGCITTLQFSYSGLASNATAMTYIGQNNYAANTLLADATWCKAICNSTYFESVLNVKVPTMTDYTVPSGEVIQSGYRTDLADSKGWYAFGNQMASRGWFSQNTGSLEYYLGYRFGRPVKVVMLVISPHSSPNTTSYLYGDNYLQGSNDNFSTYENIGFVSSTASYTNLTKIMPNDGFYEGYRIVGTRPSNDNSNIRQLQFYGREDV